MAIVRKYLINYTADVNRKNRLPFDTLVLGSDVIPNLTPDLPDPVLAALKVLLATRAEVVEGQTIGSVDPLQIQIVKITTVVVTEE